MKIITAKSAGYCFGVKRAVETVYENIGKHNLCTYGAIIHNQTVIDDLAQKGVRVIDDIAQAGDDETVVIRSHGVPPDVYGRLESSGVKYIDCTCPCVKKIHNLAADSAADGRTLIIAGNKSHPEIIGILGYANKATVIENMTDLNEAALHSDKKYTMVAQTTFSLKLYEDIIMYIKNLNLDINIYNTICDGTAKRQREAEELSQSADKVIILGDKKSSNTAKLYEICCKNCKNTYLIETINDLQLNIFNSNDRIVITAGASTPPAILKEAIRVMSEMEQAVNTNQSFEEMLNESFVTLHTGDVVKGTVIQVTNGEVSVNLGYKSDGVIPRSEVSEDPSVDPAEIIKPGDVIDVFVVRVNDGDGNVLLSKKRLDAQKNFVEIEQAYNDKASLKGKVTEVVKGGLIAIINGLRVFVPSSQISNRYVEDLTVFKGKEFNFNILEYDRSKRRIVAGRKELASKELQEKKDKVFSSIEVGQRIEGTVNRIVDFGVFVDIGGIDGLIHVSELSWGRVKKITDIIHEGDKVVVTVLDMNKNKGKISLSLKDVSEDPWSNATDKYPIGAIVEGKVVRMVPFGAFVELAQGVDGLVHISQISDKHVVKPEDELRIGEIINVKITDVDLESKKISLSKKEADRLLDEVSKSASKPADEAEAGQAE